VCKRSEAILVGLKGEVGESAEGYYPGAEGRKPLAEQMSHSSKKVVELSMGQGGGIRGAQGPELPKTTQLGNQIDEKRGAKGSVSILA